MLIALQQHGKHVVLQRAAVHIAVSILHFQYRLAG